MNDNGQLSTMPTERSEMNIIVESADLKGDNNVIPKNNVTSESEAHFANKVKAQTLSQQPPPVPPRLFCSPNKNFAGKNANVVRRDGKDSEKDTVNFATFQLQRLAINEQIDDDIGDSDDLVIFDKKLLSIDSNQSSSTDSNRSQTTIDTGYISSFENERYTAAPNHHKRHFRARFSSEDTQSSEDASFFSSDLQRADTVDSLQTNFTDSPFSLKKNTNIFNFDRVNQKISSCGSIESENSKKLPPTPPLRLNAKKPSRVYLDSGKLLQNSQILGKFNSPSNVDPANSNVNSNTPIIHSFNRRPPPLTQIHDAKMNQRQDSNISSDSFSLMSSPGYNSPKNMEVPLLQSSSKINKQRTIHQNSIMKSMRTKQNIRQDSSDSFSQTSSPGYNSKMIDAPLLANAQLKLHAKNTEETLNKNCDDIGPAIRQSASTPAMQTFVRFQNGSSSIQHKIMRARKNSNPYITRGRLKFRLCQILCNALGKLILSKF